MGQKVNPISLRLEKTNRHFDSCWYDDYNYTGLVLQDLRIKSYFKTVLNQIKYPEARLLIENLPKKTNLHLFYCNPTRSRQKKNSRFQLQDFKETKKNRYKNQNTIINPQAAQTKRKDGSIEEEWKNCLTRFDLAPLEARFSDSADKKNALSQPKQYKDGNKNLPQKPFDQSLPLFTKTKGEQIASLFFDKTPQQGIEKRHHDKMCQPGLSVGLAGLLHPFLSPVCYKSENAYNVNNVVLDFVLYTGKEESGNLPIPSANPDNGRKWVRERFFVRYLICFFYCKFLQNKRYTLNNALYGINTLHTPGLPKKRRGRDQRGSDRRSIDREGSSQRESDQKGSSRRESDRRESDRRGGLANFQKRILPALYTSNQVYKSHLESFLSKRYTSFFTLFFFRSLIAKQGATFLVEEIIYYLERKIPFRRIKTSLLREVPQYKRIKGIRISCSGRVGGRSKKAQRSKTQSVKIGVTSLGVFSSKIDFACKSAKTRFGLIGVKVWVCYQ